MKQIKRGFLLGIGICLAVKFMGILGYIAMYAVSFIVQIVMTSGLAL